MSEIYLLVCIIGAGCATPINKETGIAIPFENHTQCAEVGTKILEATPQGAVFTCVDREYMRERFPKVELITRA